MINGENKEITAWVCYCTLTYQGGGNILGKHMYRVQEIFENAGFAKVMQAFITGRNFPFTIPFAEYAAGYRAKPDEMEEGYCFLENLILSYGLFMDYKKKRTSGFGQKDRLYLILLRDGSYENEEELYTVLEKYRRLKEELNLTVCCLSEEEEQWEKDFADACGEQALLMKL